MYSNELWCGGWGKRTFFGTACLLLVLGSLCRGGDAPPAQVPEATEETPYDKKGAELARQRLHRGWFNEVPASRITFGLRASEDLVDGYTDFLMPVWAPHRNGLVFLNFRPDWTDEDQQQYSIGAGYRAYVDAIESYPFILGTNAYYDHIVTANDNSFSQLGVGVEFLSRWVDARANYYYPETKVALIEGSEIPGQPGLPVASGHQILAGPSSPGFAFYESPLEGYYGEIGFLMPYVDQMADLRLFAGYYYYNNRIGEDIKGFKGRGELRVSDAVAFDVEYYEDEELMGGNWTGGVRVTIPFDLGGITEGKSPFTGITKAFTHRSRDVKDRAAEMVIRSARIRTSEAAQETDTGEEALPQGTVLADNIVVVDPEAGGKGGDGSFEKPLASLAQLDKGIKNTGAGSGSEVIVYTRGGTISDEIVLSPNVSLRMVSTANGIPLLGGQMGLFNDRPGTRPLFTSDGTVFDLTGSGSQDFRIFGYDFDGAGTALQLNGFNEVEMDDVGFLNPAQRSFNVVNVSTLTASNLSALRRMRFENVGSAQFTASSVQIIGGTVGIEFVNTAGNFSFNGSIDGTTVAGVRIENTGGQSLTVSGLNMTNVGGNGVLVENTTGPTTVSGMTINSVQAGSNAVSLNNNTGPLALSGMNITGGAGNGLVMSGNTNTVTINGGSFNDITGNAITGTNTALTVNGTAFGNTAGITGSGVSITNSDGIDRVVAVNNTTMLNVAGVGIEVLSTGAGALTATVTGNTVSAGGNGALVQKSGAGALNLVFSGNTLGSTSGAGAVLDGTAGAGVFTVTSFAGNSVTQAGAGGILVDTVTFNAPTAPSTAGSIGSSGSRVTGDGLRLSNVTGTLNLGDVSIFNDGGTGLLVSDAINLVSTGGTIDTTNGIAADLSDANLGMVLDAVSGSGGASALVFTNAAGSFTVDGGAAAGDGGTLEGTGSAVVVAGGSVNVTLNDVQIQNFGTNGVTVSGHSGTFILDGSSVDGTGSTGDGVNVSAGTTGLAINNVAFRDIADDAVSVNGTSGTQVTNSTFDNIGGDGIDIRNTTGALILGDNTETGAGVAGDTVVTENNTGTTYTISGGLGTEPTSLHMINEAGTLAISGLTFSSLNVDGGSANMTFNNVILTGNTAANVLDINGTTGGTISFVGSSTIAQDGTGGGLGILLDNVDGNVNLGTTAVTLNDGARVQVTNGSAGTLALGDVAIDAAGLAADAVNLAGLTGTATFADLDVTNFNSAANAAFHTAGATGAVTVNGFSVGGAQGIAANIDGTGAATFNGFNVTMTNGQGLVADGSGLLTLTGATNSITTTGGRAIDLNNLAAAITLQTVSQTGGTQGGIEITGTSGTVTVTGNMAFVGGSTAQDAVSISGSSAVFDFQGTTTISGANDEGIALSGANGDITFASININGTTGRGIEILNAANDVTFNGGSIGGTTPALGFTVLASGQAAGSVIAFNNVSTTASTGDNFNLDNNSGTFTVTGGTHTQNGGNDVLDVESLNAGGVVNFGGALVGTAALGQVVEIDGSAGTVTISGNVTATGGAQAFEIGDTAALTAGSVAFSGTVSQTGGPRSFIENVNAGASVAFTNAVTITNPTADALVLNGNAGTVSFANLSLTTAAGRGLVATNQTGLLTVTTGSVNATGGAALDLDNALFNLGFTSLSSTNSTAEGIDIDASVSGSSLNVTGATTVANSTASGIDIASSAGSTFTFGSVAITTTGSHGIALNGAGTVAVNGGTIDGTVNDGINSLNTALAVSGVTIGGTTLAGGDGIQIANTDGTSRTVTVADSSIRSVGDAIVSGDGGTAGELVLRLNGNTLQTTGAGSFALNLVGSGADSTIVQQMAGGTVTGNGTGGGLNFNRITFDASGAALTGTQVAAGTWNIGAAGARVEGNGLDFLNPTGDLSFTALNVFNNNGTGLLVDTKGLGTTFALGTSGGTVNTTNGTAFNLDPLTINMTLGSVTSTNASGAGLVLDTVAGTLTIGTTTITNSGGAGILAQNNTGTLSANFGTTNITTTGGAGIDLNDGGNYTFGATTISGTTGDGIDLDGTGGVIQFGATSVTNAGANGVDVNGSTAGGATFASLAVNGAAGNGIDLTGNAGTFVVTGLTSIGATAGVGGNAIDINGVSAGAISFGDIDIGNIANNTVAFDLNGADASVVANTLDINGTGSTGVIAIDLRNTQNNRMVTITNGGAIQGVAVGVQLGGGTTGDFSQTANANFVYDAAGGNGSSISAGIAIEGRGLLTTSATSSGQYHFENVTLTGPTQFEPTTASTLYFVSAIADGAGDGSSVANAGSIFSADAVNTANVIFVLLNDDGSINLGGTTFTLSDSQTLDSFANGQTFTTGASPANIYLSTGSVVTDANTGGFGAATIAGTSSLVQVANGNTLQNFTLAGSSGTMVSGSGFTGLNVLGMAIWGSGADAFGFTNAGGNITITNNMISQNGGRLLDVNGGSANISFAAGTGSIVNTNGSGLRIRNTTGGTVAVDGAQITSANTTPLTLDNNDAVLTFTNNTVSVDAGVTLLSVDTVTGGSATGITFNNTNTFTHTSGTIASIGAGGRNIDLSAHNFTNTGSTSTSVINSVGQTGGTISFGNINITGYNNSAGTAVNLAGSAGTVQFGDLDIATTAGSALTVSGITFEEGVSSTLSATNGRVLGFTNVTGNNTFASLASSGGTAGGVAVSGHSGTFTVTGATTVAGGSTAQDAISISGSSATFDFQGTTTISGSNDEGIALSGANGDVTFASVTIDGTTGRGIEILNATNDVTVNGGSIGGTTPAADHAVLASGQAAGSVISFNTVGTTASAGDNFNLTNNSGTFTVTGGTHTQNGTNDVLDVDSLNAGGVVNFGGALVHTAGGQAAELDGSAGTINVTGNITASGGAQAFAIGANTAITAGAITFSGTVGQTGGPASSIASVNAGASAAFTNTVTITNPAADALTLSGNAGTVSFSNVALTTSAGRGLVVTNQTGLLTVTTGSVNATGGAALDFDNVLGNLTFTALSSANSTGVGLDIDNMIAGTTLSSGTTAVTNAASHGVDVFAAQGAFDFGAATITGAGGAGVSITSTPGSVTFGSGSAISGTTGAAFLVDSSNGTVSYGGSITKSSAGRLVHVVGRSGGTITFGAGSTLAATGASTGIILDSNTGGTVNFNGTVDLGTSGSRLGSTALTLSGNSAGTTFAFANLDVFTNAATGIAGSGSGTFNVTTGTVDSTGGGALSLNGLTLGATFATVNSTGGTNNIALTNVAGSLVVNGGALSGATGNAVDIDGGSATITIAASVTNAAARSVEVTNRTGGTVTFSGAVAAATGGTGINLAGNTGGTVTFSGAVDMGTAGSRLAATGLTVSGNSAGATFNFSDLDVFTNGATAVVGSGSGTLNATTGNVDATGAGALNLGALTLGVTLASANSTGGTNNILLSNVAGSLVVNGGALSGATGNAVDIDQGAGTITIASSITNSTARAVEVTGRTGGAVTLSGNINSTGTGLNVANNTGGTTTFSGTGKVVNTGTNAAVTLATNTGHTIDFTNGGLDIDTTSGTGFAATGGGTVTVQGSGNSVTTTTGTAVNIDSTAIGANGVLFDSVSTNGAANGILLNGVGANAFTASGGSIVNATTRGVDINGGSGNITIASSISTTGGAARSVEITAHTAGTVAFSGNITDNSTGLNAANNTGGTYTFSGASKVFNTGANTAVTLATNTGATISFTGGGLDIDTTTGTGFSATGGGTVNVTGSNNTITKTGAGGTGLTISHSSNLIGGSGVTFQSISTGTGAVNGIVLTNTTGSFTVTGDGTTTSGLLNRNGSGGTITGTTGDAVDLNTASNVTLRQMNLTSAGADAINSNGGGGLTFSAADINTPVGDGWQATNLTGSNAFNQNSRIRNVNTVNTSAIFINNTNTNMTALSVEDSVFSNQGAANGQSYVILDADGTSNLAGVLFDQNEFTALQGEALQLIAGDAGGSTSTITATVSNNNFHAANAVNGSNAFSAASRNDGTLILTMNNNTFEDIARGAALAGAVSIAIQENGRLDANINNNLFNDIDQQGGVWVTSSQTTTDANDVIDVRINSNTFTAVGRSAVRIGASGNTPNMDVQVNNNNIGTSASRVGTDASFNGGQPSVYVLYDNNAKVDFEMQNNSIFAATPSTTGGLSYNGVVTLTNGVVDAVNPATTTLNATILNNSINNTGTMLSFHADQFAPGSLIRLRLQNNSATQYNLWRQSATASDFGLFSLATVTTDNTGTENLNAGPQTVNSNLAVAPQLPTFVFPSQ